jgi:hypothetical protein
VNKISLEKLVLSLFSEDYTINSGYSYQSQIALLTIKSLIPSMEDLGVRMDYKRFREEIELWIHYRVKDNDSLLNIERSDSDIYWKEKDDSIFSRIIPILLANQDYDISEEEIIKNILFTNGNLQSLFETISISYLINLIINKEENVLDKLKEKIIGFGQLDFLDKYEDSYMFSLNNYPNNYQVDFEKEKIHLISLLNGIPINGYSYLLDCINVLDKKEGNTFIGKILYDFLYEEVEYNLPNFYINMADYILKLRKSRIDPTQLQIKEYILPDVFSFNEGEVFFHSLLKESRIIKKEAKNNIFTSLVQTKTGIYLFKK